MFLNQLQAPLAYAGVSFANRRPFQILQDMSGVLQPGRMTLLLGPPSSGKSTLLKALSGRLHMGGLKYHGEVTFNGQSFTDFTVQRASTYIEQTDEHLAELTCAA
jgi:ABC-type multidrug transport system ATPase subunit